MSTLGTSKSTAGRRRRYKQRNTLKQKKMPPLVAYGKIYADWCGHCVALKPEWEKVEKMMLPMRSNNIESNNKDSMVDAFNRKYKSDLPKQVGFPTIFKLTKSGGHVEMYKGDRKAESIVHWLKHSKPVLHHENKTKNNNLFKLF